MVVRDFHWLKDELLIPITPIWHRKDGNIRVHVSMCFLGYFLRQLLKLKMDRGGVEMSVREALVRLRRVKLVTVASGGVVLDKRLTTVDPCQERLLELCGVVPT